jgi:hypothetical protein
MTKITLATIKSFIRKNEGSLFINVKSYFDGMIDGCTSCNDGFGPARKTDDNLRNTAGISGAWFVNGSRDYFKPYNENGYTGYEISNCCGHFILAIKS